MCLFSSGTSVSAPITFALGIRGGALNPPVCEGDPVWEMKDGQLL